MKLTGFPTSFAFSFIFVVSQVALGLNLRAGGGRIKKWPATNRTTLTNGFNPSGNKTGFDDAKDVFGAFNKTATADRVDAFFNFTNIDELFNNITGGFDAYNHTAIAGHFGDFFNNTNLEELFKNITGLDGFNRTVVAGHLDQFFNSSDFELLKNRTGLRDFNGASISEYVEHFLNKTDLLKNSANNRNSISDCADQLTNLTTGSHILNHTPIPRNPIMLNRFNFTRKPFPFSVRHGGRGGGV
jgi:hypothetical protein